MPQQEYSYTFFQNVHYPHPYPQQPYYPPIALPSYYPQSAPREFGGHSQYEDHLSLMTQCDQQNFQPRHSFSNATAANRDATSSNPRHLFSTANRGNDLFGAGSDEEQDDEEQEDDVMKPVEEEEENDKDDNVTGFEDNVVTPSQEFNRNKRRWKGLGGLFGKNRSSSAGKKPQEQEPESVEPSEPKKQVKFMTELYISLVRSWIRVSIDSIIGTNMDGKKFWQNVADFYSTLEPVPMTCNSLRGGYRVVNGVCQNYLAILVKLEDIQRNGSAPSDIVSLVTVVA